VAVESFQTNLRPAPQAIGSRLSALAVKAVPAPSHLSIELTIAICAHNPRRAFLARTLAALQAQTLPQDRWELLLIDNASVSPLSATWPLDWHFRARHIAEPKLGVAAARIRAMREAQADLILFVDDDNVLAPKYAELALERAHAEPALGCFGGQLLPEFEIQPEEWTRQWWRYLAIRPLAADLRATGPRHYDAIPPTAGMVVRRVVWERYLALCARDPRHLRLGVWGDRRVGGEDLDLALCAFDLALGTACLADLSLTHLMPAERLSEDYLVRLVEGIAFSTVMLEGLWPDGTPGLQAARPGFFVQLREWVRAWRLPAREGRFYRAQLRGRRTGHFALAKT
jgi:glycosyltransferase involved in cell wall biosynthesis